jgi:hypothetical protein
MAGHSHAEEEGNGPNRLELFVLQQTSRRSTKAMKKWSITFRRATSLAFADSQLTKLIQRGSAGFKAGRDIVPGTANRESFFVKMTAHPQVRSAMRHPHFWRCFIRASRPPSLTRTPRDSRPSFRRRPLTLCWTRTKTRTVPLQFDVPTTPCPFLGTRITDPRSFEQPRKHRVHAREHQQLGRLSHRCRRRCGNRAAR